MMKFRRSVVVTCYRLSPVGNRVNASIGSGITLDPKDSSYVLASAIFLKYPVEEFEAVAVNARCRFRVLLECEDDHEPVRENFRLKSILESQTLKDALSHVLPPRNPEPRYVGEPADEQVLNSFSSFLILERMVVKNEKTVEEILEVALSDNGRDLHKGSEVYIEGTPFPSNSPSTVFLNSLSQGIVSNVFSTKNNKTKNWDRGLVLLDARILPGQEGSAVYDSSGKLAGMLLARVNQSDVEGAHFGLAVLWPHLLRSLLRCQSHQSREESKLLPLEKFQGLDHEKREVIWDVEGSTVMVSAGGSRGSGVIIEESPGTATPGFVLTCAHVVRNHEMAAVRWMGKNGKEEVSLGEVLYRSPAGIPFDIALLALRDDEDDSFRSRAIPATIMQDPPHRGLEVLGVGYGILGNPRMELSGPMVTRGIVSKVVSSRSSLNPVLLQCSCAVYPGCSGGGVFSMEKRELVGIIVCNTSMQARHMNPIYYPNASLAIPVIAIAPVIRRFNQSQDVKDLEYLTLNDTRAKEVWGLGEYEALSPRSKL
ncbi:unnamed protein product [Darwinula stevensoni]|uniref:Peroxisomal leader peptide-processing protease n=1 Tax=Darwinula stevensoni TaxID=69355 RepID=A0A7R8XDZ4_9CRUS|nr:unnamed protein product [Darwinula stevensoni]CAG0895282.1 unnamed protein product [Darwinula stevensoni]